MRFSVRPFLTQNYKELKFITLFILLFLFFQISYYIVAPYTINFISHYINAVPASKLINILTPNENTKTVKGVIHGQVSLSIKHGCNGIEGLIILFSAILAFHLGIKYKLLGLLFGTLIVYASNFLRIILLYYTYRYEPDFFEILHVYIGQSFTIFVGIFFFIVWIKLYYKLNDSIVTT